MNLAKLPLSPSQLIQNNEITSLEEAFIRGKRDFYYGQRVEYKTLRTNKLVFDDVKKRRWLLSMNKDAQAAKIYTSLFIQGFHLTDTIKADGTLGNTLVEISIAASDPYKNGSLLSKEWNRGFNAAYFANQQRVRNNERKLTN